ncbi:MAG: hypothetical protein L3J47_11445 [Sulfurovum sp.]|nr:hypothetical protein [Sulfurovum sp.]
MARVDVDVSVNGLSQLTTLDNKLRVASSTVEKFRLTVDLLKVTTQSLGSVFSSVAGTGFEYNKSIEQSKAGIISLSVAMQDKAIPVIERYAYAQKEATVTLKELERINAQTPHTLQQTNEIYKAMYPSMKQLGISTAEMVEMTRAVSTAAGAAGIQFQQLLAGVDGLATGTVASNSELGRFFSALGLTNEALKETDDLFGLVTSKLGDFGALDTITEATSNLENAWSQLLGKMTEDSFSGVKIGIKTLTDMLNSLSDEEIKDLEKAFEAFGLMSMDIMYGIVAAAGWLVKTFNAAGAAIAEIAIRVQSIFDDTDYDAALDRMWEKTRAESEAVDTLLMKLDEARTAVRKAVETGGESVKMTEEETDAILNKKEAVKEVVVSQKELDKIEKERQKAAKEHERQIRQEASAYNELSDMIARATMSAEEYAMKQLGDDISRMGKLGATSEQMNAYYVAMLKKSQESFDKNTEAVSKNTEQLGYMTNTRTTYGFVDADTRGATKWQDVGLDVFTRNDLYHRAGGTDLSNSLINENMLSILTDLAKKDAFAKTDEYQQQKAKHAQEVADRRERRRVQLIDEEIAVLERKLEVDQAALTMAAENLKNKQEELRKEEDILAKVNRGLKEFAGELQSIIDSLSTNWYKRARDILFGGTDQGMSYNEAKAAAEAAWALYRQDPLNGELLKSYNERMDDLMGTLDQFDQSFKYTSAAEQKFAKAKALRDIEMIQGEQDKQKTDTEKMLEKLQGIIDITEKVDDNTNVANGILDDVKQGTIDGVDATDKVKDQVTRVEDATRAVEEANNRIETLEAQIKSINAAIESKKVERANVQRQEWVQTGATVESWQSGTYVDGPTVKPVINKVVIPQFDWRTFTGTDQGYYSGGYTGDYATRTPVGVVHGQEYVINAQTTKDLGINGNGGIFQKMERLLFESVKIQKRMYSIEKTMLQYEQERIA